MVTATELREAEKLLLDPWWRLNNLYYIVDKEGTKRLFKCNWAQQELYRNMWYCNIILKARQLGMSTFICLLFLDRCLFNSNVAAGILAHTLEDAQHMFKRIKYAYDCLPEQLKEFRVANVDSARELTFNNASSLRVGNSLRGGTFQYLHISEFGKISSDTPDKAREIVTGSLNTLAAGQYCFIESTAEGREGYFYNMCKQAQDMQEQNKPLTKLDFKFAFYPWWRCPDYVMEQPVTIPKEMDEYFTSLKERCIELTEQQKNWYVKKQATQLDDMKREYPSTPEESFETARDGAYFARSLSVARMENRIGKIFYNPELPVHSAWDLGFADSTSIWLFQVEGKEIHLLEYIENSNEPLTYYLKLLKAKDYVWGRHLCPHDIKNHEYGNGLTRLDIARKNGFNLTVVPDLSLDDGIDAVRYMLNRCFFDEAKCARGLTHIDNYKRAWNSSQGCWSSHPVHNAASHAADALRTLAVGLKLVTEPAGPTDDDVRKMEAIYNPRFG